VSTGSEAAFLLWVFVVERCVETTFMTTDTSVHNARLSLPSMKQYKCTYIIKSKPIVY
jgi:hypothetical protein